MMNEVPMVDLEAQYNAIKKEIDAALADTLHKWQFILGPELKAFEAEVAAYVGVKYAAGVASGTDALRLALLACGLEPGDEVITTPFTFFATAEVVTNCGATPVFVDIEPDTYNIDPARIEAKITPKTRALLPVHLYGQPSNMGPILDLARKYKLSIVEDCAQALGADYEGHKVGSIGDAGCLSFFPSKALGAYGDGGMVVTDSQEIYEKVIMLRNHGCKDKYYNLIAGFNSRLDELQAAILRVKLRYLDNWNEARRQKAASYTRFFAEIAGVTPPASVPYGYHSFNYYTIRLNATGKSRDALQKHLGSRGIATAIYYPLSLHLQKVYEELGYHPDLPVSEQAQREVISLPVYPEMTEAQIEQVVAAIKEFVLD